LTVAGLRAQKWVLWTDCHLVGSLVAARGWLKEQCLVGKMVQWLVMQLAVESAVLTALWLDRLSE